MNAGEMTDKELMKVSGEAEELLAGASMLRSADVVGELRRRYLLLLAEKSAAKMEKEKVKVRGEGERRKDNPLLECMPGVCLIRFKGDKEVILMARRNVGGGNPNVIYKIHVVKATEHFWDATITANDNLIASIECGSSIRAEKLAISSLRRYLKECARRTMRCHRLRKAKKMAKKSEGEGNGQDQQ